MLALAALAGGRGAPGAGRPGRGSRLREALGPHPQLDRAGRGRRWAATPSTSRAPRSASTSRETAEDVARTLACYHAVICARVLDHDMLVRMAGALDDAAGAAPAAIPGAVPVVNLLSDRAHPCQALADLLTLRQALRRRSTVGPSPTSATPTTCGGRWRSAAAMAGIRVAHWPSPDGYEPDARRPGPGGRGSAATSR